MTEYEIPPEIESVVESTDLPRRLKDKVYSELENKEVTVEEANDVVRAVVNRYEESRVDPLDPVGTVSAQSIGEPGTQMSIPADEQIVIRRDSTTSVTEIGPFVDAILDQQPVRSIDDHEVSRVSDNIEVLSLNDSGDIRWQPVEEVSRHDAPDELLEFSLASGRSIRATKAHSFVTREDGEIVPVRGDELAVGNRLPVVGKYNIEDSLSELDLRQFPTVSERATLLTDGGATCQSAVTDSGETGTVPSTLPLNDVTGRFIGAWLADGTLDGDTITILSTDPSIRDSVRSVATHFGADVSPSDETISVHSDSLVALLEALCLDGTERVIPEVALGAALPFVQSLLSGYLRTAEIDTDQSVTVSPDDPQLIEGISFLLSRLGVYSNWETTDAGRVLSIPAEEATILADHIETLSIGEVENSSDIDREGDVVWDTIIDIETVSPEYSSVYDVSVSGLETFTTASGTVTHNTMNTFHYAGVAEIDVTQGLPRLIELVDARKEPDTPMMTVYLEDEYATDRERAHEVVWQIEATQILSLGDVSTNVADMIVQVNLNDETLLERWPTVDDAELIAEEIADTIQSRLGVKTTQRGTVIEFGPEQPSYRDLLQLVEELREITFKGIDDISRVVVRKEETAQGEEFVLYTEGSAFGEVLTIDGVDATRTSTNDIHEIYQNLGVEAAREAIINETMETLEEQGLDDVNIRHLMLVADIMTNRGTIESIGRHGISGSKDSVLARAAFEVTVSHLLSAAVHGEIDDLDGVTENVIVGKPIKLGTGDVNLRMGSFTDSESGSDAAEESAD